LSPQNIAGGDSDARGRLYAKGCIAGADALPINGDTWQVMRLSRNRNFCASRSGRAAENGYRSEAHKDAGWPEFWSATCRAARRPMITGHASHRSARCRHLLTRCRTATVRARARGEIGGDDGAPGPARHRSEGLDPDHLS